MDFDLLAHLKELYNPNELELIIHNFKQEKGICAFLNTLKTDKENLKQIFTDLNFIQFDEYTFGFKQEQKAILTRAKSFDLGHFYIQNRSSYLCAKSLQVRAEDKSLDMCAAPGGKSINLANFMHNQGSLACVELNKTRFFTLQENLKKYGVKNARCFLKDSKLIGKLCPQNFDKILLDAPCSSFAKFGFKLTKSQKELKALSLLQKKLLNSALKALKINAELIYSTCTFTRFENEEVIENALNSNFKIKLLPLDLKGVKTSPAKSKIKALENAVRILPDEFHDGFFICKIKKLA